MQEKALVAHLELHKKVVKNAWILSYEGRKVLVIDAGKGACCSLRVT
nr:MAG TPA: AAA domain protein [Caudoviricetes sp.]